MNFFLSKVLLLEVWIMVSHLSKSLMLLKIMHLNRNFVLNFLATNCIFMFLMSHLHYSKKFCIWIILNLWLIEFCFFCYQSWNMIYNNDMILQLQIYHKCPELQKPLFCRMIDIFALKLQLQFSIIFAS